jgi:hypothetical protein
MLNYLTVDGETPYKNTSLLIIFVISYHLIVNSNYFESFKINKIWRSRLIFIHEKMLKEPSATLKSKLFFEEETSLYDYLTLTELERGMLSVEKSYWSLKYFDYKKAKNLIEDARNNFKLKIGLTGKLGRKTKFQDFDSAVLVLDAESATLTKDVTP